MKNKFAIVTGGASGIGLCIAKHFLQAGATVAVIDINQPPLQHKNLQFYQGDIANRATLKSFVDALSTSVDILINNACTTRHGVISACNWEDFEYVQRVGITAPYYLTQLLLSQSMLAQHASIVNIASTRGAQSQADTESYSAAKGGILALTHALSVSLAGRARVNAISPGWIDNTYSAQTNADETQHPAGRVGKPEDIAEMVLFLCDNTRAGFITGENIVIDGGISKLMIYNNDNGWRYEADAN